MTFDKSRVYTALNADELKVGSEVYVSDNMYYLKKCVEDNLESCILARVMSEKEPKRFCIDDMINEQWQLAYLIEPPAEPKYKPFSSVEKAMEAIKKHGGWIKCRKSSLAFFIVAYDEKSIRIYISGLTGGLNTEDLYNRYVFADDGTPCGELVEE